MNIRVFQVDDWAYVAAYTADQAESFIARTASRPDDPEDFEIEEIELQSNPMLSQLLVALTKAGEPIPALLAIDRHYA